MSISLDFNLQNKFIFTGIDTKLPYLFAKQCNAEGVTLIDVDGKELKSAKDIAQYIALHESRYFAVNWFNELFPACPEFLLLNKFEQITTKDLYKQVDYIRHRDAEHVTSPIWYLKRDFGDRMLFTIKDSSSISCASDVVGLLRCNHRDHSFVSIIDSEVDLAKALSDGKCYRIKRKISAEVLLNVFVLKVDLVNEISLKINLTDLPDENCRAKAYTFELDGNDLKVVKHNDYSELKAKALITRVDY